MDWAYTPAFCTPPPQQRKSQHGGSQKQTSRCPSAARAGEHVQQTFPQPRGHNSNDGREKVRQEAKRRIKGEVLQEREKQKETADKKALASSIRRVFMLLLPHPVRTAGRRMVKKPPLCFLRDSRI